MKFSIILSLAFYLFACNQQEQLVEIPPIEKQYVLTNEISMRGREVVIGASSYLVELNGKLFLCTAKHLTTSDMGFEPSIDLKTFKDSLLYWKVYARTDNKTDEVVDVEKLFYADNDDDIILFSIKNKPKEIGVLKPQFKKLPSGSKLRILGCQYSDIDCSQKVYSGVLKAYTIADKIEVHMDSTIELSGFSGAPVLDDDNNVIGHVSSGGTLSDNILRVYVTPMYLVNNISKH